MRTSASGDGVGVVVKGWVGVVVMRKVMIIIIWLAR